MSWLALLALLGAVLITLWFWRRARQNEKLKEEFITTVTHKFRTPMTGIKWAVEMLHNDVTFQKKEDLLKEIEKATERIREIVDLLTGFATLDAPGERQYELTSLHTLIEKTLERYAQPIREKKIAFNTNLSGAVPSLMLDKTKIQFVLDVLLENALQYTPPGGLVGIGLARNKQNIRLSVSDNGLGIKSSDLGFIFKRFWRSDAAKQLDTEGMGLGLYTARRIIERLGGRMWVESPGLNLGSTFFVELPITGYDFKFK